MGKDSKEEVTVEVGDTLKHEGWSDLREKPRNCTDVFFLLLIIAAWVAMTIVGFIGLGIITTDEIPSGDPRLLTNAMDYNGDICGHSDSVKDFPYAYYFADASVVCVDKCPSISDPEKFICHYDIDSDNLSAFDAYTNLALGTCFYQIKGSNFLNRCIPSGDLGGLATSASIAAGAAGVDLTGVSLLVSTSSTYGSWFQTLLTDLYQLQGYIYGFGVGVTVLICFGFLCFLRIPYLLTIFIWTIIFGILACLIAFSVSIYTLANDWKSDDLHTNQEVNAMFVFSYVSWGFCAIFVCVMIAMRKRIQIAVLVVRMAARALFSMPSIFFLPVLQVLAISCFFIIWLGYCFFLATSGDSQDVTVSATTISPEYTYSQYVYTENTRYAFIYMLFIWFWTSEFIVAMGQLVISLTFAAWFFTRDRSHVGWKTVAWALRSTIIYHAGTAAFGSLILAIVRMVRAVMRYLEKKSKKAKNKVVVFLLRIAQLMLRCLESVVKFISKKAYMGTAIYSWSFCRAARNGFMLYLRNVLRVAAITMVSGFLLFLGRLFLPLVATFLCYLSLVTFGNVGLSELNSAIIDQDTSNVQEGDFGEGDTTDTEGSQLSGVVGTLAITYFLSFIVTSVFMTMFTYAIDCLTYCFLADEEMFPPEQRFASSELRQTIDDATAIKKEQQREKKKQVVVRDSDASSSVIVVDTQVANLSQPETADIVSTGAQTGAKVEIF